MHQILCVDLADAGEELYRKLYQLASPERKARAERCRNRQDALRCVTADALVRYALGTDVYTLIQEKGGKPQIAERPDFHFNISHSGRWVIMAWGDSEVGVDVEQIRQDVDLHRFARRYFTEDEQAYLQTPDSHSRFFALWTRKESYLKYLGTGLTKGLAGFSVLNGDTGMEFWQKQLPGDYWLCLCSQGGEISLNMVDIRNLAEK